MLHALFSVLAQGALAFLTGNWWLGAVGMAAVYIGREHAQAEYRWIEQYGFRRRANMPWWGGFDPKVWDRKSLIDWLAPLLATAALLGLYHILRGA